MSALLEAGATTGPATLPVPSSTFGSQPGSVAALRAAFRDGKAALLQHFIDSRSTATAVSRVTRALARHVDATITVLWEEAGMPTNAALVAVGGYGRGELFPHSDVDVLVLLPGSHTADTSLDGAVERFRSEEHTSELQSL